MRFCWSLQMLSHHFPSHSLSNICHQESLPCWARLLYGMIMIHVEESRHITAGVACKSTYEYIM